MFTSRAEFRILLRQDNADLRLTPLAHSIGMDLSDRMDRVRVKEDGIKTIQKFIENLSVAPEDINGLLTELSSAQISQKVKLHSILLRPNIGFPDLRKALPELDSFLSNHDQEIVESAEIKIKYAGYIRREQEQVDRLSRLESVRLYHDLDYHQLESLSSEAREKLSRIRPETIGQASRISGVSPSDVSVLLVHMGK